MAAGYKVIAVAGIRYDYGPKAIIFSLPAYNCGYNTGRAAMVRSFYWKIKKEERLSREGILSWESMTI